MTGSAYFSPPGRGEKATSEQTEGRFALLDSSYPAGGGRVPPHVHHDADEGFYVLEGELTVWAGSETVAAPAGSSVLVPRGTVHSIGNTTDRDTRFLMFFAPGGMEGFFREQADLEPGLFGRMDDPNVRRQLDELAARYQMEWRDLPA